MTITPPYEDTLGAGKVVTMATTVMIDDVVFGVLGMDVSPNLLFEMMTRDVSKCHTHQFVKILSHSTARVLRMH